MKSCKVTIKGFKELMCFLVCYILILAPLTVQAVSASDSTNDTVINNGSLLVKEGDWLYYRNSSDGGSIYKIRTDGTQNTKLNDISSCNINVQGDWIYFKSLSHDKFYEMYRMKKNGLSSPQDLNFYINSEDEKIIGDYIYYGYNHIYLSRIKTDGTGEEKLSDKIKLDNNTVMIGMIGNYVYYILENTIFRCDLDGNNKIPVFTDTQMNEYTWIQNCTDTWIYIKEYDEDADKYIIYRIKPDGSEKEQIYNGNNYMYVINDDWFYDEQETTFKRIDGSKVINQSGYVDGHDIYSKDNWIYYESGGSFYALSNDGTQKIKLYSGDSQFDNYSSNCIKYNSTFYYINGYNGDKFLYKFDVSNGKSEQLTPEKNIQKVSADKKWTVVFTKKFDPSTINSKNILVTDGDNDPVDISVVPNSDGKSITISKSTNYDNPNWEREIEKRGVNQIYNIKITQNVKDIDGHKLKRYVVKKFGIK